MMQAIDGLLQALEQGAISRRQALVRVGALATAMAGAGPLLAGGEKPASTFRATEVNHVALRVTDVPRSRDFYRKQLGLSVLRDAGERNCFLNCGRHFVALFHNEESGLNHYCYTIKGYDAGAAVKTLADAGLEPRRRENRVYFDDPDGITVQVSAPNA